MLSTTALVERVVSVGTVTGRYTLPNGGTLTSYFDEYRVAADPDLLFQTGLALAALLPPDVDVVAGLELGGVPFALAVSAATGLPAALIRKTAKPYGTCLQVEGQPAPGARVAMVDDVIRSGRQILIAAAALRQAGTLPTMAVAILIRQGEAKSLLAGQGIKVNAVVDETATTPSPSPRRS
ncbi:orotate phosphoribosyltransferase [Winogradskya humida]|uniref:Orotate phosphoribosyltransferase n=1 Tax=Winogradskya humida TaxID=113566 RepID=A0ABQ3ZNV8_9ACTN|nr:orotate phosphoribosyltransferase [Actinoplanes humidus]GIE20270.1 orotate phosphoribosyltransferase [Actinoplanes humidus]